MAFCFEYCTKTIHMAPYDYSIDLQGFLVVRRHEGHYNFLIFLKGFGGFDEYTIFADILNNIPIIRIIYTIIDDHREIFSAKLSAFR